MPIRTVLVPLLPGDLMERRLDVLLPLARQLQAHINVLLISPDPAISLAYNTFGVMPPLEDLTPLYDDVARCVDEYDNRLIRWREANGVPSGLVGGSMRTTCATFDHRIGSPDRIVAAEGRVADLIVIAQLERSVGWITMLNDAVVFETGRPVLFIPPSTSGSLPRFHQIAIAWNGSLEAARALAGAMPLLQVATGVVIIAGEEADYMRPSPTHTAKKPGERLSRALEFHDIHPTYAPLSQREHETTGEAILRQARASGAEMIVMGAFTHSRIREFLLGGVTRYMLTHAELPLLMAN